MCIMLNELGFTEFNVDNPGEPLYATKTYLKFRNLLFHNGEIQVDAKNNNQTALSLEKVEANFCLLLSDVFLRLMGYNDPSVDWNRWSRQLPFGLCIPAPNSSSDSDSKLN